MALVKFGAFVAGAIAKSKVATRSVAIPTLRVVGNLLGLVRLGIASDVNAVREDLLMKSKAEANKQDAAARQSLAAAIEAENHSQFSKQRGELEMRLKRAEIAKSEAEARRSTAVARIAEAQASSVERLLERGDPEPVEQATDRLKASLRRLSAKGGHLLVDASELKALEGELQEDSAVASIPSTGPEGDASKRT